MGIQGLLPLLKSIMTPIHVKELEGCVVAVDTYSWLHKGALSCSTELCKGQPTSKHIDYCMHRVNMLCHYGVKPLLVFDGGLLPMKSEQEMKRSRSRRENLSRAMEHESNGNLSAAYECYQKAIDISPSIAHDLIQVLKKNNVSYVVAPYEADAQMTFLALSNQVEAVITEDSDLIAFGCPRIIYKMDKFGQGVEFKNSVLEKNRELNLTGFSQMMMLEMCILSGCDYLQSLPGMGLKKAHTLMKKCKSHEKVIKHLKFNGVEVTPLYEESFKKAIMTFKHQRVYDPITEDIVHLSEPAHDVGDALDFLGPSLPQHTAKCIACGDLDPFTKLPIQRECEVLHGKYQLKNFKPDGEKKKLDLPVQKNLLTNYFCFASLEAKRKFRAPRVTPKCPNENNETSSLPVDALDEVKHDINTDNLKFLESLDRGLCEGRGVVDHSEMGPLNMLQDSVYKPCISLHKDLDSNREDGQARSGNKNVIVRSSYFQKKSRKENEIDVHKSIGDKFEDAISKHAYKPVSVLFEGKCRKEEKRVTVRSSYFQHRNMKENCNYDKEKAIAEYTFETCRFDIDSGDCKPTADDKRDKVKISSYENEENPESRDRIIRDGIAIETCKNSILGTPSSYNSLECLAKKRKVSQTNIPTEDQTDNTWTSGTTISDLKEQSKTEESKFSCNITHLSHYSNIAETSVERFVSVISSFRYNPSGSRASGLRAPLKDIKNNRLKR